VVIVLVCIVKERIHGGNMFKWFAKKLTKNYAQVPLFWVVLDLTKMNYVSKILKQI
jgi:hypothetical protein